MTRKCLGAVLLTMALGLPVMAAAEQSLGELAREFRDQRDKATKKATKIYTNDDLPARPPGEYPTAPENLSSEQPTPAPPPVVGGSEQPAGGEGTAKTKWSHDKIKSKDYWQPKFKALREQLAKDEEDQQLVKDEINLLQIQAARELNGAAKQELEARIKAKQDQADASRAATAQTRKKLEDLEKEFKESGAPAGWSESD